jgi:hypothetical protein
MILNIYLFRFSGRGKEDGSKFCRIRPGYGDIRNKNNEK